MKISICPWSFLQLVYSYLGVPQGSVNEPSVDLDVYVKDTKQSKVNAKLNMFEGDTKSMDESY